MIEALLLLVAIAALLTAVATADTDGRMSLYSLGIAAAAAVVFAIRAKAGAA